MKELAGISGNITDEKIKSSLETADNNYKIISKFVDDIVNKCCGELDEKLKEFKAVITDKNRYVTDEELDYMIMELPCLIYFASDMQESIGLNGDLNDRARKDLYNRIYVATIGRVADKECAAEIGTHREAITSAIISTAYKKVKNRIDAAFDLISSMKKVISRRIATAESSSREDE